MIWLSFSARRRVTVFVTSNRIEAVSECGHPWVARMRMFWALVPALGLAACVQAPRYAAQRPWPIQQTWPTQQAWPAQRWPVQCALLPPGSCYQPARPPPQSQNRPPPAPPAIPRQESVADSADERSEDASDCTVVMKNGREQYEDTPGSKVPCLLKKHYRLTPEPAEYPGPMPHGWNSVPLGNGNWWLYP